MAQNGEMVVTPSVLNENIQKLATLEQNLRNRKLNISFNGAKGSVPDKLTATAEQLRGVSQSMCELAHSMQLAVIKARDTFDLADLQAVQEAESIGAHG